MCHILLWSLCWLHTLKYILVVGSSAISVSSLIHLGDHIFVKWCWCLCIHSFDEFNSHAIVMQNTFRFFMLNKRCSYIKWPTQKFFGASVLFEREALASLKTQWKCTLGPSHLQHKPIFNIWNWLQLNLMIHNNSCRFLSNS